MSFLTAETQPAPYPSMSLSDTKAAKVQTGLLPPQKALPPLAGQKLTNYPFLQPVRTKVFLPQGKLTDYPLLLDFSNLDESLSNFHRL